MPTPDYSQAGVNRDRPAVMPATGSVLRRELTKARVVELPDGIVDGDVLTFDAASSAIVAEAPVLPPSPPTGTGFRHMTAGSEDGAATATVPIAEGGTGQTTATLACTALLPTATTNGTLAMWNGTAWAILAPGSIGDTLKINGSGVPAWTA